MAHVKVMSPGDWRLGVKAAELVRFSSRGLVGDDLTQFIKRAGHCFENQLHNIKIAKDEVPLHVIALGTTEAYGPNRNGDGFKAATCRAMHDTFVKAARWYRNHKNKDPAISYGVVKASAFNEQMQRVELLIALNAEKSAADRNGGFVADEELKKIAAGEDIPVSMACKVAYDVCASCGNKARHREEYCTEDSCVGPHGEKRGGCKHHLTDVAADGFINHVDNPGAEWFDMSKVWTGADRIAYGGVADYLQKAASGHVLGGAALAEAWGLSPLLLGRGVEDWTTKTSAYRTVERLVEEESGWLSPDQFRRQAAQVLADQPALDLSGFQHNKAGALGALAAGRISLSPADFVRWQTGDDKLAEDVAARLPGIYTRLLGDPQLPAMLRNNPYEPAVPSQAQCQWASKQSSWGLHSEGHARSLYKIALYETTTPRIKQASTIELPANAQAERLARAYALYKVAMLDAQPVDRELDLTVCLAVAQNYV